MGRDSATREISSGVVSLLQVLHAERVNHHLPLTVVRAVRHRRTRQGLKLGRTEAMAGETRPRLAGTRVLLRTTIAAAVTAVITAATFTRATTEATARVTRSSGAKVVTRPPSRLPREKLIAVELDVSDPSAKVAELVEPRAADS